LKKVNLDLEFTMEQLHCGSTKKLFDYAAAPDLSKGIFFGMAIFALGL
jgi:hypothetical protein